MKPLLVPLPPRNSRGVALVITLVMLSVVTLMALTFLAVSRRERSTVIVSTDLNNARLMAESATARARSEVISRMLTEGSLLAYDIMASTNFINPVGFDPGLPADRVNLTNVNYDHLYNSTLPLNEGQRLRNIANLQLDPRPPVYVPVGSQVDFRFFHDLNRNARFDTNGLLQPIGVNGLPIGSPTNRAFYVGDPEWIGLLEYPDRPHSATNRFIGRYAYLILPAGKSLDWNFVHNNTRLAEESRGLTRIGYFRNQGVGTWELNLAGFFRDLNPTHWFDYRYTGLQNAPSGRAFEDALGFLRYRYAGDYLSLLPARRWFINTNATSRARALEVDRIDTYTDGPVFDGYRQLTRDRDNPDTAWVGSDNPSTYFELSDLMNTNKVPVAWFTNLVSAGLRSASFDRYTYYRMLGQIGMESGLPDAGKINLNYDNLPPYNATNMVPWTPLRFFTNVANRMIVASRTTNFYITSSGRIYTNYYLGEHLVRPSLSVTNIQIYPYNEYSPVVHRLLQLAVNLYDATTNRAESEYPYLPTVFRPTFGRQGTNLFITGYTEVTNANFLANLVLRDLTLPQDRAVVGQEPNVALYNIPFLIGAKKGYPNFNEFALQNVAQVTRKAQARKRNALDRMPATTNLMYLLTISNQFGIEAWNSYTQAFNRPFRMQAAGAFTVMVTNYAAPGSVLRLTNIPYFVNLTDTAWASNEFRLPILRSTVVVTNEVYQPIPRPALIAAGTNVNFIPNLGYYTPQWGLSVTNRFYYAMVDTTHNRLVDFVCLGGMTAGLDITRDAFGNTQPPLVSGVTVESANVWLTNRTDNSFSPTVPTEGVVNQMRISLGEVTVSRQQWRSYNADADEGQDKEKSIDLFREFCGLTPLVYNSPQERQRLRGELTGKVAYQAPYTPTRKIYQDVTWQVNDPLVHYTLGDLLDPYNRPDDPMRTNSVRFAIPPQITLTNANLGVLNESYRPWGGNPNLSVDVTARSVAVKDPLVRQSEDWEFPGYKWPGLGWIGRVHRGTPWQTFYLKGDVAPTNQWQRWAGSYGTHPTNDWSLIELFTAAPNDNAARGQMGVNQTNVAAWSAVLRGVSVLVPSDAHGGFDPLLLDDLPATILPPDDTTPVVWKLADAINRTRRQETNLIIGGRGAPYFHRMGRVLATPELTYGRWDLPLQPDGTYGRTLPHWGRDEVLERIPQQVLSLLKEDEPRFVIYAFGQALREAPGSVYLGAGTFNQLCTNYQVKAEFVSKSVIRLEGPLANPRAIVESYNELLSE